MNEPNPFVDDTVAQEWIRSVEGETGLIRDKEIYPLLTEWSNHLQGGVILEVGSGQGICSSKIDNSTCYIGIEPSIPLVARAIELYGKIDGRSFHIGNAYQLPIATEKVNGAFSVNVWFHLGDLDRAAKELARVLKKDGEFLIITANPATYDSFWYGCYSNARKEGKMTIGKVDVPINSLSQNTFFSHRMNELTVSLEQAGLTIHSVNPLGKVSEKLVFVAISGKK